jgi:hypothetical protein
MLDLSGENNLLDGREYGTELVASETGNQLVSVATICCDNITDPTQ